MTPFERATLVPLVFFDLFDRPVPRQHLLPVVYEAALTEEELDRTLDQLESARIIKRKHGYVYLADRKGLVANASLRWEYSLGLWRDAQSILRHFASIPFLRMAAVVNSLSFWNAGPDSDIDLLVVAEPGYLPTVRDHINLFLTARNRRNTRPPKRGKVAVDILLTSRKLSIEEFALPGRDIYFDFWAAHVSPVITVDATYDQFVSANKWVARKFPGTLPRVGHVLPIASSRRHSQVRLESWYRGSIGSRIQRYLAAAHLRRMRRYEERVRDQGAVVVSEDVMRFNIPDRRQEYQEKFEDRWHAVTGSPWS